VIQEVKWSNFVSIFNKVSEKMSITANMGFDKGKALLDWVVIWGVRRKIDELDPTGSYTH
jgi:hypothetical protein